MKIKGLLLGMFACAALASCTNDDIVENNGSNQEKETVMEGDGYMTVKFAMSGDNGSRAFGDDGFQTGTADEVGVTKAIFFFLDAEDNGCALPATITDFGEWGNGTSESVDKKSDPIIVIKNPVNTPKKIVAILNTDNPFATGIMPSLAQILNAKGAYTTQTANNFVMSNSVYVKGDKVVNAVDIPASSIKETEEAAKAAGVPVVIPVERVLAKVELATKDVEEMTQTITNADGTKVTLAGEITGWWLDSTNPTSYLVKNLSATYASFTSNWWNDEVNQRSYWANSATPTNYNRMKYTDMLASTTPAYCLENTDAGNPTTLVLAVKWTVNKENVDLIRTANTLYTKADFFTHVAQNYSTYRLTTEESNKSTYKSIENILDLETQNTDNNLEAYEAKIIVKKDVTNLVKVTLNDKGEVASAEKVEPSELQALIQTNPITATVNYWNGGQAYYFKSIEHNGEKTTGIVRNHLYRMNITKVSGLGTPVANPDLVVIPTPPPTDKESYIAAEIEILKYKVVPTQNVAW